MKLVDSDVRRVLINSIADTYDLLTEDPWMTVDDLWDTMFCKLIRDLALYIKMSNYCPDGVGQGQLDKCISGMSTPQVCKAILSDVIVTKGMANLFRPIDTSKLYRMAYDSKYEFIPEDKRPKDDFMNKPV